MVCELVSGGESVRKACEAAGVPKTNFLRAVEENQEWQDQYARARQKGADAEFERLQDLADELPPLDAHGKTDSGWVQWNKLRIDTAKWMLSKKRPERYGDRVELEHKGQMGLTINIDLSGD